MFTEGETFMTGLDYANRKIQVSKDDSLLRYMQDNGIDYSKHYDVVEPEEFDCE